MIEPIGDVIEDSVERPSRLVAEALVLRLSPQRIAARAAALGCSKPLVEVMVGVCHRTQLVILDGANFSGPSRN